MKAIWNAYKILDGQPKGRSRCRSEDIRETDLKKVARMWTGFVWLRIGPCGGLS
jgi:hypothetical protein